MVLSASVVAARLSLPIPAGRETLGGAMEERVQDRPGRVTGGLVTPVGAIAVGALDHPGHVLEALPVRAGRAMRAGVTAVVVQDRPGVRVGLAAAGSVAGALVATA